MHAAGIIQMRVLRMQELSAPEIQISKSPCIAWCTAEWYFYQSKRFEKHSEIRKTFVESLQATQNSKYSPCFKIGFNSSN